MIPTLRDVTGAPVPGLPNLATRPPLTHFRDVLRQLLPRAAKADGRPQGSGAPVPVVRPSVPVAPGTIALPERSGSRPPAAFGSVAGSGGDANLSVARRALAAAIRHASATAGVEPALSIAVARAESNLDPRARSRDGLSVGTFQVTFGTAAAMRRKIAAGTVARPPGSDDVALGVGYLRYLHDLFGRSVRLARGVETFAVEDPTERQLFAVAAFNAGEGRVARAQARAAAAGYDPTRFDDVRPFLPAITQNYVGRVVAYARQDPISTVV